MWVEVKRVQGMVEALIVKGLLEANDIPVKLRYEAAALIFGITMDGIGEVGILVPEELKGLAERIIAGGAYGLDSESQ